MIGTDRNMLFTSNQRLGTYVDTTGEHAAAGDTVGVCVRVEIRRDTDGRTHTTVDHGTVTDPVDIGFTGETFIVHPRTLNKRPGWASDLSGGQIRGDLSRVTDPAPGWTLEEIREVSELWESWHLNTMTAACAHMPADELIREPDGFGGTRIACGSVNTCPVSGYTYGAAWLTRILPDTVQTRVRELFRDRSAELYAARGYDAAGKRVQA